ncbi:MAG: Mrp/NBP35 family ATP-binding protein [Bacteriovoracaceae bacterium]|nr:Mrp/NBP35 family ATP-binding protein [Bacteriovoracaceae bacterium]
MKEKILKALSSIKNPATGASFEDEKRWKEVLIEGEKTTIVYARDGISPQEKRVIESFIVELLKDLVPQENLTLRSVSANSSDVFKAVESPDKIEKLAPAQIKTGHAAPAAKKNVPGVKHVIAIGSGKGGVGKSTFTVNLAASLSAMGLKIGIIDADIYGPSVPMLMGKRFEKPLANSNRKIVPIESHGIKFMSFGLFVDEKDPVIWRGPMLGGVLNQFLFDAEWDGLDYLLIDLPPGTGDIQLSMVQNCHVDGAIVISTPQDVALLDATKGLEMFRKLNLPIIGMVENMSSFICSNCHHEHFLFGEGGVEKAIDALKVPFLGKIPLELELRQSADAGSPYMANPSYEGRPVARSYQSIAGKIEQYFNPQDPSKPGLFSRLFGR